MSDYSNPVKYKDNMMYLHSEVTYTSEEINLIKDYYDGILYTPTGE